MKVLSIRYTEISYLSDRCPFGAVFAQLCLQMKKNAQTKPTSLQPTTWSVHVRAQHQIWPPSVYPHAKLSLWTCTVQLKKTQPLTLTMNRRHLRWIQTVFYQSSPCRGVGDPAVQVPPPIAYPLSLALVLIYVYWHAISCSITFTCHTVNQWGSTQWWVGIAFCPQ